MRALYIGFNRKYINPYTKIIQQTFANCTNLNFYGPGFNSKSEISLGIDKWIKKNGNFDILILDGILVGFDNSIKPEVYTKSFKNNNEIIYFKPEEYAEFAWDYVSYFIKSNKIKFTFTTWDPYNTSNEIIQFLISSNTFILDFFGNKLNEKIKITQSNSKFQSFFRKDMNDNWVDFENKFKHKIISFPHAIFSSEFFSSPLENRKHNFSIIGVLYPERKAFIKFLNSSDRINLIFKRLKEFLELKFNIYLKSLDHRIIEYQNLIENSKFCLTSGSPLRYPVRKYFEVPSKGSIPIGFKCNGFENLGFKNEENFLVAEDEEQIKKHLNRKDFDNLQLIANNAKKLILEKHSDVARYKQFTLSLKLILDNKFKGSYWNDGEYKHY